MRTIALLVIASLCLPLLAAEGVVPGIHVIRGEFVPGRQPDGNSVIIEAPEGLIVVDTGRHAAHTQKIIDHARKSNRPIVAIINTHWHLDHISGNELVRKEYPNLKMYTSGALTGASNGFLSRYRRQLESMLAGTKAEADRKSFGEEIARIDSVKRLVPDFMIEKSGRLRIGGADLDIRLESHAVTSGDLWIRDTARGIVIAGDLVTFPAPFLDTACPSRWSESLARLEATEFELLIPGHGAPMTKTQFRSYRRAFDAFLACARTAGPKERCIDGWIEATTPLFEHDAAFTRSIAGYYVDLLRGPADESLCGPRNTH